MSQISPRPSASKYPEMVPKARSHRRVVRRGFGYAGAAYLLVVVAAAWIGDTLAGGETYLDLAIPALALTILAPITARGGALLGLWPNRRMRRKGENGLRFRSETAVVPVATRRNLTSEGSVLPAWLRGEPRVWHFTPLVLLALWTLIALFRAA